MPTASAADILVCSQYIQNIKSKLRVLETIKTLKDLIGATLGGEIIKFNISLFSISVCSSSTEKSQNKKYLMSVILTIYTMYGSGIEYMNKGGGVGCIEVVSRCRGETLCLC